MKKLILTAIGLIAGATLVQAQGYIEFFGSVAAINTNSAASYLNSGSAVGQGKIAGAGAYDFALLVATNSVGLTANPLNTDWTLVTEDGGAALQGSNGGAPGSLTGPGTSSGIQVDLAAGTAYSVELVGWSAALGASWSTVSGLLADGFAGQQNADLSFGSTGIGTITPFATPGTGDPTIFPTVYSNGSFVLFSATPVPEPATLALAGLGGLSMLFLRRRKS